MLNWTMGNFLKLEEDNSVVFFPSGKTGKEVVGKITSKREFATFAANFAKERGFQAICESHPLGAYQHISSADEFLASGRREDEFPKRWKLGHKPGMQCMK